MSIILGGRIILLYDIRWQNLPAASDYITMELSSASCDPLVTLRKQLQFIESNISVAACKKIWPIVLAGVDSLMMSEVIYNIGDIPYCVTTAGDHDVLFQ